MKGKLAGQPLILEEWQRRLFGHLLGWKREDGTRRYRRASIWIARKNGKTMMISALMLFLMLCDGEMGAELYAAAADRENARILFDLSRAQVETNPILKQRCQAFRDSIVDRETASTYKVISSEAYSKHGFNSHGVAIDELHSHPDRELFDVLKTSTGSREQPLVVTISTAGVVDETSFSYQEYLTAKRVAVDPSIDPEMLPVIFEVPMDADWRDPRNFSLANPALAGGSMIRDDYLRAELKKALDDPAYENTFRRLHLNQWTSQITRWIPLERWQACGSAVPTITEESTCVVACDLSYSGDLSAIVRLYPTPIESSEDESNLWQVWVEPVFFLPDADLATRIRLDHAPYDEWARKGIVRLCPGATIDDDMIEQEIRSTRGSLRSICFDPYRAAGLASKLEKDGLPVEFVKQGIATIAPAAKLFEGLVNSQRIHHANHPAMNYCIGNVAVKTDDKGNAFPVKRLSRGRIDGLAAMLTGLAHLMLDPLAGKAKSIYETRGVTVL